MSDFARMTPAELTVYSDGRERARTDDAMRAARNAAIISVSLGGAGDDMEGRLESLEEWMVPASGNVRRDALRQARKAWRGFSSMEDSVRRVLEVDDDG